MMLQQQGEQIYPSMDELLENLFYNWKICRNIVVEQLRSRVCRARADLQKSKADKQTQSKHAHQKQQQAHTLSKSLYQLSMKRKQVQQQNDILRKQLSQQRGQIFQVGALSSTDYQLMGKEIQQQIYLEQKDRIQSIIDKKLAVGRQGVHPR